MANPELERAFDENGTNIETIPEAKITDGYQVEEVLNSASVNTYLKQLYDAANKNKNDGTWEWEDPLAVGATTEYNTGSMISYLGENFISLVDLNTATPINDKVNWVSISELKADLSGAIFTGQVSFAKGADVASAEALPILTDGNYFDVTGTTTITSINTTGAIGTVIKLHFDGILTLTHHATDLILPSGANITTAAGDEAEFIEYAAGDFRCTNYTKADGTAIVGGADTRLNTADEDYAGQAAGEEILNSNAGEWIKNQCTAWVVFDGVTATIKDSFNVASVVRNSAGLYDITFEASMDNVNYNFSGSASYIQGTTSGIFTVERPPNNAGTKTVSVLEVNTSTVTSGTNRTNVDCEEIAVHIFGGKI